MGRFSLFIQQKIIFFCFILASTSSFAKEVQGLNIPNTLLCEGKMLPLQGTGLRTATVFNVKVFVLAYYAKAPVKKGEDANLLERPICFDITYLREFDNEDVDKAWDYQFKESSDFTYPSLPEHITEIKKYFGEIKDERKESFYLSADTTKVLENNKLKGEIKGKEFQKNFLSLWFGKNPPTKKFQAELFGEKE